MKDLILYTYCWWLFNIMYVYLKVNIAYVVLNDFVTRRCVQCLRSYRKQQMKCCKFHMSLKQTLKNMEKAC